MQKHRIRVDLHDGKVKADAVDTIEVGDHVFYGAYDGSLRPITAEVMHSGGGWIVTTWHDHPSDAWAEAAEELTRRIQKLADLRTICLAGAEVIHV